jgi:hypothetical protein
MTYRPADMAFGPPLAVRLPSAIYLLLALVALLLALLAERSQPGSWLYENILREGSGRVLSIRQFGLLLFVGAIASVLRSSLRGVRLRSDGIESREVVSLLPRARRYKWAQIDRITLSDERSVLLDLWDGSTIALPRVRDRAALAQALERVAYARAIPLKGGLGLDDLPDRGDFYDEEEPGP